MKKTGSAFSVFQLLFFFDRPDMQNSFQFFFYRLVSRTENKIKHSLFSNFIFIFIPPDPSKWLREESENLKIIQLWPKGNLNQFKIENLNWQLVNRFKLDMFKDIV